MILIPSSAASVEERCQQGSGADADHGCKRDVGSLHGFKCALRPLRPRLTLIRGRRGVRRARAIATSGGFLRRIRWAVVRLGWRLERIW